MTLLSPRAEALAIFNVIDLDCNGFLDEFELSQVPPRPILSHPSRQCPDSSDHSDAVAVKEIWVDGEEGMGRYPSFVGSPARNQC